WSVRNGKSLGAIGNRLLGDARSISWTRPKQPSFWRPLHPEMWAARKGRQARRARLIKAAAAQDFARAARIDRRIGRAVAGVALEETSRGLSSTRPLERL